MLLRIAICEDNPVQTRSMKCQLTDWSKERKQAVIIQTYAGSEAFLSDWMEKMDFDLLLLDIDLGREPDGMELARHIRQKDDRITIIFVTGLAEYMSQGYDVRACHFLVKPVEEGKLKAVLDKALKEIRKKEDYLILEEETELERIPVSRILYAEAFSHTTVMYLTPEKGEKVVRREVRMCLSDVAELLPCTGFFRCHRSYLVHLLYIRRIDRTGVFLDYDVVIPVSRGKREALYQAFLEYHRGEMRR